MTDPSPALVVGLDLSLRGTGIAHVDGRTETFAPACDDDRNYGLDRMIEIRDHVIDAVPADTELVVIEALAFAAHDTNRQLAKLAGIVTCALYERGDALLLVPPATVKKYATGKGTIKKEEVLAAAIRRLDYQGASLDEADALWLRAIGAALVGVPVAQVPLLNQEALLPWLKVSPVRHREHRRV